MEHIAQTHALVRTSPKGTPFLGTCMNCGRKDMPMRATFEECDNPRGATQEQNLLDALMPKETDE